MTSSAPIGISGEGISLKVSGENTPSNRYLRDRVIPWCDVIACNTDTLSPLQVELTVHYIHRNDSNIWREDRFTTCLEGEQIAKQYAYQIRQHISKDRPQRLLVLINTIAGRGDGEAVYRSTVKPLMELAEVQCTVKVSEYCRHIEYIISTCDLDNTDSIVLLGGDGTYQEVVHALIPRVQKQHGVDHCDISATLEPVPVSIGIIPTGTGNGLAQGTYGCVDVETAVLHVITGKCRPVNVVSVHSDQDLTYFGLVGSVGSWCDLQNRADGMRWMGTLRHKIGLLSTYLLRNAAYQIDLTYLPVRGVPESYQLSSEITQDHEQNGPEGMICEWLLLYNAGTEKVILAIVHIIPKCSELNILGDSANIGTWRTISGTCTGVNVFPPCFYEDKTKPKLRWNQDGDGMLVVLEKPTSRWNYASWMGNMQALESKALHYDFITHFHASALRLRVKNQSDTSACGQISVDGEMRLLDHREINFKVHRNLIRLFSSSPQDLNV